MYSSFGNNSYLGEGSQKCYHLKGYEPDFNSSTVSSQSHFDTSTDDVTHKTPEKKGNLKKENLQISILQMFAGYVVSCGNLFRMRKVTHSGQVVQGNHANVKGIAITNATGGYTTGVPTFFMTTRILGREIWQIGPKSISFVLCICQLPPRLDGIKSSRKMLLWRQQIVNQNDFLKRL